MKGSIFISGITIAKQHGIKTKEVLQKSFRRCNGKKNY
jgi:Flp pilus assembly protein TadB